MFQAALGIAKMYRQAIQGRMKSLRFLALGVAVGLLLAHSMVPHQHADSPFEVHASSPVGFDLGQDHLAHYTVSQEEVSEARNAVVVFGAMGNSIVHGTTAYFKNPQVYSPAIKIDVASGHGFSWAHRPPPSLA
jgi:hypothetical protein